MFQHFHLTIAKHVARLTFNRPEKANALHLPAWEEMQRIFEALDEDETVRVIVLSGAGKHFCAGIDLELLMSVQQFQEIDCEGRKREQLRRFILKLQKTVSALEACRKPVIAAVTGACVGGGLDILAACDLRYCTAEAFFSIKEIDLGMVADLGTLQRLPGIIGPAKTAELAYTGRQIAGPEAERIGLVNQYFPDLSALEDFTSGVAAEIAARSPLSIRGIKEMLLYTRDHSVPDALDHMSVWNAAMLLSNDLTEAFSATLGKRRPEFE